MLCKCVMDLDWQSKMIIFESILTTFEASVIFQGSWGSSKNWLEPETVPPKENLTCPNLWNAQYASIYINQECYKKDFVFVLIAF